MGAFRLVQPLSRLAEGSRGSTGTLTRRVPGGQGVDTCLTREARRGQNARVTDLSELLRVASRTFALGIELLPRPLRRQVEVAYLLLRVSDYLEDNRSMQPGRKAELLRGWERVLAGAVPVSMLAEPLARSAEPTPDGRVAREVAAVHAGLLALAPEPREVVASYVRQSTLGMARWVERGPRFETEADLDDYMHEVAGRVGYLLTDLFALHAGDIARCREPLRELGREFGLALQTVNVIRGLHEDRNRGWVFVPRSFLPDEHMAPEALFAPSRREAAMGVLDRLVRKADRHFIGARGYLHTLPRRHRRVRLFCLLPLLFGVRTLAVSRGNPRVFEEETKISRDEVRRIARAAGVFGSSRLWIEWYCGRLSAAGRSSWKGNQSPQPRQVPTSSSR